MHEHPEDHEKIEKLKDLIAWQVNCLIQIMPGPSDIQRQPAVTCDKIQASNHSP